MSEKGATGLFGSGKGIALPTNRSQLCHIFDDRPGHLPDTPRNRQKLIDVANEDENFLGEDENGHVWHAKVELDGTQTWTVSREGTIQDGGSNDPPRVWDDDTGLNNNPKKRRKS